MVFESDAKRHNLKLFSGSLETSSMTALANQTFCCDENHFVNLVTLDQHWVIIEC